MAAHHRTPGRQSDCGNASSRAHCAGVAAATARSGRYREARHSQTTGAGRRVSVTIRNVAAWLLPRSANANCYHSLGRAAKGRIL